MTKIILVIVTVIGGNLNYGEIRSFETMDACKATFNRLVNRYRDDGVPLRHINGACYRIAEE